MLVVAELGSGWLPEAYPLADAVQAALDCGADLVKIQLWTSASQISKRRGGVKGLEQWQLKPRDVLDLADKLYAEHKRPVLGLSVFHPDDIKRLGDASFDLAGTSFAFLKSATQEYQYAALAEAMGAFSAWQQLPLIVSVPRDGCLVVGNYHSPLPLTWLQCVPAYPACFQDYCRGRLEEMRKRLPGKIGLSDHSVNDILLRNWLDCEVKLDVVEKHFLYHEDLRGKVPDGGPWALSRADFKAYAKIAHGQ